MARTVLVTGVSGGLGGAVARRLVDDGWRVVAPMRPRRASGGGTGDGSAGDGGAGGASEGRVGGDAGGAGLGGDAGGGGLGGDAVVTVVADVTDEAGVARAVAVATADPATPLRAVVNLVGGFAATGRVHETPVAEFEAQLRINLRPAYLVTAAALPHLIAAGGGSVVCVGSRAAVRPFPGAAGYITSKAALLAFVDALAVEYRDDGVRVNAVLPSVIDTPANRSAQPAADVSRWVPPEQIADVIAFLCSEAAAATSGAHVPVYGRA